MKRNGCKFSSKMEVPFFKIFIPTLCFLLVVILSSLGHCTTPPENGDSIPFVKTEKADIEEKWGIKILSIRQSAAGYMLDFRYRVIDPNKAAYLNNRKIRPYLIDQESGSKLLVPNPPKVGPLRQTSQMPIAGRTYFILFANPAKYVKPGNKVTVLIGDFKAENLIVE